MVRHHPVVSDGEPQARASVDPSRPKQLGFHIAGVVVTAAALVVASVALAIVGLANECADADEALRNYRLSGVAAGLGVALVPTQWALLARSSRRTWIPWAIAAAAFPVAGAFLGFSWEHDPTGPFC